jgi:hypothetical protein
MLNEHHSSGADPPGAAQPPAARVAATPEQCEQWANLIHDQVLQSLGLCLLQADLCRRLWDTGQPEQALAELQGVNEELDTTVDTLRQLIAELLAAARTP